jgi:hypothetical protein
VATSAEKPEDSEARDNIEEEKRMYGILTAKMYLAAVKQKNCRRRTVHKFYHQKK